MSSLHERQVELAMMDESILNAKNILASIQKDTEAYLFSREEEAGKRVDDVVKASELAIDTAFSNFKKVEKMRQDVDNIVYSLNQYGEELKDSQRSILDSSATINKHIDARIDELSKIEKSQAKNQKIMDASVKSIELNRKVLAKQAREIADKRARLSAAMKVYDRKTRR